MKTVSVPVLNVHLEMRDLSQLVSGRIMLFVCKQSIFPTSCFCNLCSLIKREFSSTIEKLLSYNPNIVTNSKNCSSAFSPACIFRQLPNFVVNKGVQHVRQHWNTNRVTSTLMAGWFGPRSQVCQAGSGPSLCPVPGSQPSCNFSHTLFHPCTGLSLYVPHWVGRGSVSWWKGADVEWSRAGLRVWPNTCRGRFWEIKLLFQLFWPF